MFSRKKIWISDIICVSFIVIIGIIFCIQDVISGVQLFIGVLGAVSIVSLISLLLLFKTKIVSFIKEEWKYRISLIFKVIHILHKSYEERMIETIFSYFVHYYNMNVSEIAQDREFPKEEFPEGSFELVKVFIYITQLRKRNNKLLSKIDYTKSPVLFNMSFNHLKFKINKNYELQITGDNDDPMSFSQYKSFETKVVNALYDTDTQIASWLIKNRNHFGF